MPHSRVSVLQVLNSSVWITVLVVRVGCIIEAHPSPNENNLNNNNDRKLPHPYQHHTFTTTELEAAESQSVLSSPKNSVSLPSRKSSFSSQLLETSSNNEMLPSTRSLSLETTTTAPEESDDCSGKADGYYQNFGSGCSSYYFCAAGYQITYVCPRGQKYTGKRCQAGYSCPTNGDHVKNDCSDKSNGYYPSRKSLGKYFYCFHEAKVVELQCDAGKVFVTSKCLRPDEIVRENGGGLSCATKSNGFYQDLGSRCEHYYYCIGGEKRELKCQQDYIFNGDICVHHSRYECPKSVEQRRKLISIVPKTTLHNDYASSSTVSGGETTLSSIP